MLDGWASTTHLETVHRRTVLGGREHQAHDQVEQAHCLVRGPGIEDLTPSVSEMFLVPLCEDPNLWQQITNVFGALMWKNEKKKAEMKLLLCLINYVEQNSMKLCTYL